MTKDLAHDYLKRARVRIKVLAALHAEGAYADVVREAQEAVELLLKGYLRSRLIDPPRWHDMSPVLARQADALSESVRAALPKVSAISTWLKKERELSFYGDDDFIPSDSYSREQADKAIADATWLLALLEPEFSK